MDESPSFEHEALEADMKRLAGEIVRLRKTPEAKDVDELGLLKMAIKALPPLPAEERQKESALPSWESKTLPGYATGAPPETKLEVEYLIDIALHQGIGKAQEEARKSPPFVEDAFRDALAGKLYPEFKKRGLLK